jgi:NADPH:quinone reductase-like Zn-dependent oxidoreductase
MKALKIFGPNDARIVSDAPKPTLSSPNNFIVKIVAIALNPTDWKHIEYGAPSTVGCDCSGIIEEVGSNIAEKYKKGDRVFTFVHGSNKLEPDNGAFAEYAEASFALRIPEGISFEEAAAGAVGIGTVGQGLYQEMGLPWPESAVEEPGKKKKQILIWGGSSGMGAMGIQFAKLWVVHLLYFFYSNH